ncbi:OLC1v1004911C1 [Oldenlandia corymbosa var. corymbosa]|uniref:OLC1v1004911C1 n=1 Tax=Oldenlandia corymbosa var. corymbosa TaxID=529605 RepID=A0AAV1DGC5_OLDCO|nr:OLC1v1004911C1 [Oldenlandia corymbosa var. corymbosa]
MEDIKRVSVWIQLPRLPLRYWTGTILSRMISTIGKLIEMDDMTTQRMHTGFARILVEMEIQDTVSKEIWYKDEMGSLQEQEIRYEWKPVKCGMCKGFGHEANTCRALKDNEQKRKVVEKDKGKVEVSQDLISRTEQADKTVAEKEEGELSANLEILSKDGTKKDKVLVLDQRTLPQKDDIGQQQY